jgi:hypothetical protein
MTKIILLDSTPVGLITNPKSTPLSTECQQWFSSLFDRGYSVVLGSIKLKSKLKSDDAHLRLFSSQVPHVDRLL